MRISKQTKKRIKTLFPKALENENIAPYTTFGIGGNVAFYLRVKARFEFEDALKKVTQNNIPFVVMSGGSNTIFPDKNLDVLAIHYLSTKIPKAQHQGFPLISRGTLDENVIERSEAMKISGTKIYCDTGVPLKSLIKESIKHGLSGLETLSGIPGTVGGATVGNAGAYGHSISECVKNVYVFDGKKVRTISKRNCKFKYRSSIFKQKNWFVLGVDLEFKKGDSKELAKISRDIIRIRNKKYKPGLLCPGSFFKNVLVTEVSKETLAKIDKEKIIEGKIPAGYLLQSVGACGMKKGGIYIASFHGNLLVNDGSGKFKEVKEIAQILKKKVKNRFDITLEEEVRYILGPQIPNDIGMI